MKKIFVGLLAVAALASCQKNEVLNTVVGPQIAFENAAVDNATRAAEDPSTTTGTIDKFSVWGYMDKRTGKVFENEIVSKSGSDWTYANTQYWLANHEYYFAAVSATYGEDGVALKDVTVTPDAAETAANYGIGTIDFVNADGTNDLLYASSHVSAGAEVSAMPKVNLVFSHLLSKVKFTFTNGFENPNSTIKITGVTMTAPESGSIDLNVENWWDNDDWTLGEDNVTLAFGDVNEGANLASTASSEADNERLTIPAEATQEYTVKFHVQLYNGEVLAVENDITTKVTGVALEMGKAYNFKAEINASNIMGPDQELYPIEFTVEVKEWEQAGNVATELKSIEVAKGQSYTLVTDATASTKVSVAGTFDGAGHTVTAGELSEVVGGTLPLFYLNADNATVRNTTIDGNNASYVADKTYGVRNIVVGAPGEYTIDNVTSINATYPLYVAASEVTINVVNSELQGWTSYGETTTGNFQNVAFTAGTYARFRPYGTTVLTNCSFVDGFVIDLSYLAAGETVTFVNCTYNGAALATANITTVDGTHTMAGTYEIK